MASIFRTSLLALLSAHIVPSAGQQSLTACPSKEVIVQDSAGNSWASCPNTDYNWNSLSWVGGISNVADCATYCTKTNGCAKAVFDHVGKWCHAKADVQNQLWKEDKTYDAIRPYTGPITTCPAQETNVTDSQGRIWAVCQFSDYQGWTNTDTYTRGIQSNADCVKLCAATNGCVRGVFDRVERGCHVKTRLEGLVWSTSTRYDSMRMIADSSSSSPSPSPSPGFKCDTKQSVLTTKDGSTFALCTGTDWQGASIYVLNNFNSAQACAEVCSLTPVCSNAIWDTQNNICHIKGAENGLQQTLNNQFDQIRLIKKAKPVTVSPSKGGKWSDVINFPVVPAAVYVVPQQPQTTRIMAFSANADQSFGARTGLTQFATFDYTTGSVSKQTVSNTQHDMFCPGISSLQDGRIVVNGGSDAATVSIYNPATNSWSRAKDMNMGRGYQSSTTLSNGKVFTIGGSFSGGVLSKNGEVFDPSSNTWTMLNGCSADALNTQDSDWRRDNHAWLHAWSNGAVFQAGPSRAMNWYGTSNGGSTTSAGTRNATDDAMCAVNVMYDTGKILAAGGTPQYDDTASVTTTYLITVPNVGQKAAVEKVADLKYPRAYSNGVVLPDGCVIVFGGQWRSRQFTDIESTLYPEMFDPRTKAWTVMNAEATPRNYHSSSVLLGDGTVFSGGGGLCWVYGGDDNAWACDPSAQHPNGEIFSPPYLFNADGSAATRPIIKGLTTSYDSKGNWVRAGGTLTVTMGDSSATTFSFVRLGSSTHSTNTDQRRLSLTATQGSGNRWSIKLPSDSGIVLPGYWYLFAMNRQGTPSIARVVQVKL